MITNNQAKITNRVILHCKKTYNQYIIRCFICNTWDLHQQFISPHELLKNLRSPNNLHTKCPKFNCVTEGTIYALQCSECQKIYVGQTGRILKTRIQEHLRDIKYVTENSSISKHFHTHESNNRNFEVFILEFCKNKFERLIKEDIWISILVSSYPTGMNQHSDGHYATSHIVKSCFMHFQHDRRCTPLFETILL